ncbi:MAG TPA: TonB-dependent receptor [Gammaproteobacteria bacterium]|nr:TonB-dependent receptor [Gammaproteobacteria bacterium]
MARAAAAGRAVSGRHASALLATAAGLLSFGVAWGREPPHAVEEIDVVGTTPLGGAADAAAVPANVQAATAEQIRTSGAQDLAEFMKRAFAGVFVNEAQSNPLQPDVQYRGFVGSPLLGLAQGLAVYQDGVRLNEPFGDTVSWALVPESAIESVYLVPGSNPLFGLNALGGALSLETKDGFTSPGTKVELSGGSWSRVGLEAETGGSIDGRVSYFVTGSTLSDDGWRDFSPTDATQGFAKVGWRRAATSVAASVTYADTDLTGNGAAPVDLLARDRSAVFTHPDETKNALTLLALSVDHRLGSDVQLTGNVYSRRSDIDTLNGDGSDFAPCTASPGLMCEQDEDGEEEVLLDADGEPVEARAALSGGTLNRTSTRQTGSGAGLQAAWSGALAGRPNQLVAGVVYDRSDVSFGSSLELGALDATRGAVPGGVLVEDGFTRLDAETSSLGLYVSDVWSVSPALRLTLSARANRSRVALRDLLGDELTGTHEFRRLNPAAGLTLAVTDDTTFYASYSESSRTPSPVELTCADPDAPCRLPNAFLADPPLDQVVAKTIEAGVRGRAGGGDWHAGLFDTVNEDDILFVSAGALTNQGYFANVGRTRRRGLELAVRRSPSPRLGWFASYTLLDATFENAVRLPSPHNPDAADGEIAVAAGDRLPLVPRQLFKAGVRIEPTQKVALGADLLASGEQYLRGDESNLAEPLDGYALVNLHVEYRLDDKIGLFANVDNVFDSRYETFGVFGDAAEVLGPEFRNPRFVSPGGPRAAWIGVRLSF